MISERAESVKLCWKSRWGCSLGVACAHNSAPLNEKSLNKKNQFGIAYYIDESDWWLGDVEMQEEAPSKLSLAALAEMTHFQDATSHSHARPRCHMIHLTWIDVGTAAPCEQ